jgi:hypothetical protein
VSIEICRGILEFKHGFMLIPLVFCNPGGLLKHPSAGIVLIRKNVVDHTQGNDCLGI